MIKGGGEESTDNLLIIGCGAIECIVPGKVHSDASSPWFRGSCSVMPSSPSSQKVH